MTDINREELTVQKERALLVGVLLPEGSYDKRDPLGELRQLAKTADADVCDEIIAKRQKPDVSLYVGKGKAQQIAERCEMNEIEVIIFDNDLSPGQIRDLEKITKCKVVDRSELILDIFASHASSAQSTLQVELAQLEYTYPRLTGMWTHLDRHGGGVGTRGPGERQIETDRRIVQKRVSFLKRKLAEIDRRKLREVKNRSATFSACLVGYTNAGKSTTMNALTGAGTFVANQLFATLETKTRQWDVTPGGKAVLSDTVGFVRDLPHHLVASFRATLEEAIHADLLLHVADASSERLEDEIDAVNHVLEELGCDRSKLLLVLNKTDQIFDPTVFMMLRSKYPDAILISAVTGRGLDELVQAVSDRAGGHPIDVKFEADVRNGKLMQYISQHAHVVSQDYNENATVIEAIVAKNRLDDMQKFGKDFRILSEKPFKGQSPLLS